MRSSCDRCHCEIVTLDGTHAYVTDTNKVWVDLRDNWEAAPRVTADCGCRCHETAKRFLTLKYQ